jgi:hypothetical protein
MKYSIIAQAINRCLVLEGTYAGNQSLHYRPALISDVANHQSVS